ncbi:unnamed protein product, partial [Polarella glacialis]
QGRLLGSFGARLEAEEKQNAAISTGLRSEMARLQQELQEFVVGERKAREAACKEIAAAETLRHEALVTETRKARTTQAEESRQWAQALVERLSSDLRSERE